jgi:antitoxin FitA
MNKHIQIRNVPRALHKKLVARARKQNITLSEYLRQEMARIAALPTLQEMTARLRRLPPVKLKRPSAELIREDRDSR